MGWAVVWILDCRPDPAPTLWRQSRRRCEVHYAVRRIEICRHDRSPAGDVRLNAVVGRERKWSRREGERSQSTPAGLRRQVSEGSFSCLQFGFSSLDSVMESHQETKLDTSGTAKAVIACFNKLGVPFDLEQIQQIRDPEKQLEMVGVPEEHLSGHAFHLYHLTSPDQTVSFEFQHNVCGRSIYAEGSIDAAIFLHRKVQAKAEKKIYDMVDVLKECNVR